MPRENTVEAQPAKLLQAARRVVIKLGTSTVTGADGELCADRVEPIVASIARLIKDGRQVVLVSSGAVGLGRGQIGLHRSRLHDLVTKQACAAVGQSLLMNGYKNLFTPWGIKIAQVLLTEEDFTNWRRYSNLRQTMEKLLAFRVVPIVNQNDTVSTAEIESVDAGSRTSAFSDNDRLAALVMSGLEADALALLTNVDGLLNSQPASKSASAHPAGLAQIIPLVPVITPQLRALAAGPSQSGRGGMVTKLEAAEIASSCGGITVIANGQTVDVLDRIFAGEPIGTVFPPSKRIRGKRRWIAFMADVRGTVVVDEGAQRAVNHRKASLLASGILSVKGLFTPMDVVSIVDRNGGEFARGIAECASLEVEALLKERGSRTSEKKRAAASQIVVRRDNIVLFERI
jgi:glutamate 5-kinase